jgi:hypothetical protein
MIIATTIISATAEYYTVWDCAKIESALPVKAMLVPKYPACAAYAKGTDPSGHAMVLAKLGGATGVNAGAALNMTFGMALWLSTCIHAIGVEIYLHLTPKEAQRLRNVSYQRQLEAGMRNPGSAGLTTDRLGDADQWVPEQAAKDRTESLTSDGSEHHGVEETK